MGKNAALDKLSREELLELIDIYAKNWLALDGVWFQSIERTEGMDAAMYHDGQAWERFTAIEAKRLKAFLGLGEHPGLEGLEKALSLRFYANLNEATAEYADGALIYTMKNAACKPRGSARACPGTPARAWGWWNTPALPGPSTNASPANASAAIPTWRTIPAAANGRSACRKPGRNSRHAQDVHHPHAR